MCVCVQYFSSCQVYARTHTQTSNQSTVNDETFVRSLLSPHLMPKQIMLLLPPRSQQTRTCIWHRFHKGKIQKKNKIIKSIPATACGVSNIVSPSRITAFQDTWPKLEKWFVGRQNILVRVDANVDEVELHKRVESALQRVMMQTQEGNWLSVLCVFTISLILCIWA